jgi:prefoldin subunit 5
MSFEESIEKLKERHEALTQTVEIIASMHKETERQLQTLTTAVAPLVRIVENRERRWDNLDDPGNIPPSSN